MTEVENLSKRYGEKLAVDGLDFVVQPQARAARRRTEPVPTLLIADGRRCQALLASGLQRSDAPGPTVWRRRSGPPWRGSVPAAAHSGWLRSSATTPRQPPSACAGCVRCWA